MSELTSTKRNFRFELEYFLNCHITSTLIGRSVETGKEYKSINLMYILHTPRGCNIEDGIGYNKMLGSYLISGENNRSRENSEVRWWVMCIFLIRSIVRVNYKECSRNESFTLFV